SFATGGMINASPVVVDPDGTGKVVFFGDNGVTGEDDGGHFWAVNGVDPDPAADCSLQWRFDGFGDPPGSQPKAGSWSPPAFSRDLGPGAKGWEFRILDDTPGAGETRSTAALLGRRLFLGYGSGVYALDVVTGARIWKTPLEATPDLEVVSSPAVAGPAGDE